LVPQSGRIVVVGASLAGLQAAQTFRRADFDGALIMIGDEPHYPYDRPPLSKQYLAGEWPEEKLRLRAAVDPEELGIDWRLGTAATSLDLAARSVALSDGSTVDYDGLVIATGAAARSLPGAELAGVHVLRSLDDAIALRHEFDQNPRRVCVIGAGFIGAEVAATARERGLEVSLIEAADAPMSRVLDQAAGMAIADLHRSHGVEVRLGVGVEAIVGSEVGVERVQLVDGSSIEADCVVIGIGVVPNTAWLEGSGLRIDNGVVCDETCLAAPSVVAAGDVARWPNRRFGSELTRVEQWDNAVDQGAYAARRLLATANDSPIDPFTPVPWFWSDQYDRKIQLAGVPSSRAEVVHGSIAEQRFVQIYSDPSGESLVGALAWNRPRQAIMARQLVERGASMDEGRADLSG
jgi:3-phenylpropionate/trans-cinnamate dioxygenase ferredoxin reductase subunit